MSIISAISGFFRGLFVRRYPTVAALPAVGNSYLDTRYAGAGSDGSKWPGGLSRTGSGPILNHHLLRINSRSAYHTSLQARGVVERHTDTVVDNGLKLNATPDFDVLGITPEAAEEWARRVDASFDHWARNKKATASETMNFYQLQRLAGISQQRDGEYFCRFTYSVRKDLLNPLQLSFIDPIQIKGIGYTSSYGINQLFKDGIERDINGREIAYQVGLLQADYTWQYKTIPAVGPRSGRRMMIHGFQAEYANQGRGYPRLSHALQEFENITDFSAAEIKKAIAQSCISMFVKPSKENVSSNPLEAISHQGPAGPVSLSAQATQLAADNNVDPGDLINYIPVPEATVSQPGAMAVFNLTEGEELKPFANTSPVESFERFVNTLAGHLSASLSIPLEVVLMKFAQNYSASRASLILFWRIAQIWRDEMVADFLNPVYENWLAGEIAAGRISAPGWADPRLREAWLKNNWVGSPMPNIDPAKTAKADQLYVEMGAQTLDRVAQNLNGTSGKANRAKLRRELEELPPVPWGKNADDSGGGDSGDGSDRSE
jgi:lambda family phage portal protein